MKKKPLLIGIIILFCVCTIFLTIFLFLYTNSIVEKTVDSKESALLTCLDFAVESTDYLFEVCAGQPMQNANETYSFIAISFSSSEFNINASELAKVKSDLRAMAATSPIIDRAFFYVPNADIVLSSDYTEESLASSRFYEIINMYESGNSNLSEVHLNDSTVFLFRYGNDYILAQDMFVFSDNKQSTLFIVLNRDEIYQHIRTCIDDNSDLKIFIYDVFGSQVTSSNPEDINLLFDTSLIPEDTTSFLTDDNRYLLIKDSDVTNFKYYLAIDESYLHVSFSETIATIIPFAIALFLFICLITVFTTLYFFRPFRNAIDALSDSDIEIPSSVEAVNEFDYLSKTISTIVSKQNQLRSMMRTLSDDVLTQSLTHLLKGEIVSYENLSYTLDNIESEYKINSVYVVGALRIANDNLSIEKIDALFAEACKQCGISNAVTFSIFKMDACTFAILIRFTDRNVSISLGKETIRKLTDAIHNIKSSVTAGSKCGFGHIYHSILDIGLSYKEALEVIAENDPSEDIAADSSYWQLINHRAGQIASACCSGSNQLDWLTENFINEVSASYTEPGQLKEILAAFIQSLISCVVEQGHINYKKLPDIYAAFTEESACAETSADVWGSFKNNLNAYTSEILVQRSKHNNPYVLAAESYISEHYSDSTIGLEDVAESIGISSSYLSKIFSESTGDTLFDYLTSFRIEASLHDLAESDLSINEIAEKYGFSVSRNYIRAFKKFYNETPGEYRKSRKLSAI